MNSKVYMALTEFISDLKRGEKYWKYGADLVEHQLDSYQGVLKVFGKNKQEQISTLMNFAALLITEPEQDDSYPAINFINGKKD